MRARPAALAVGVVVTLSAAGAAVAYFVAPASGSGPALTRTAPASLTLTPGTASTDVLPGGTGTVRTTVSNGGDTDVRLASLQLDTGQGTSGFAVDPAHAGCTLSSFGFTAQSNGGSGWTVPAGGSLSLTLGASLPVATSAPNACQGAAITVYLKAGS